MKQRRQTVWQMQTVSCNLLNTDVVTVLGGNTRTETASINTTTITTHEHVYITMTRMHATSTKPHQGRC